MSLLIYKFEFLHQTDLNQTTNSHGRCFRNNFESFILYLQLEQRRRKFWHNYKEYRMAESDSKDNSKVAAEATIAEQLETEPAATDDLALKPSNLTNSFD